MEPDPQVQSSYSQESSVQPSNPSSTTPNNSNSTRVRISVAGEAAAAAAVSSVLSNLDDELSEPDQDEYIDDDEIIVQHRKRRLSIEFPTTDEDGEESDTTDTTPNIFLGHHRSSGQLEWDNNILLTSQPGVISTSQTFSNNQSSSKFKDGNNNQKSSISAYSTPAKSSTTTSGGSPALHSSQYQLVIVGEQEFRLDMKAIEPYKKVLAHGGYTGASGLTAVVIFTAAELPDTVQHNAADYQYIMHNIFLYVVSTLDLLVAQDYVLIYLNGACKKRNLPGLSWLRQCYKMIDRRLRKSLKKLLIVHPTFYLRTMITIFRPFVSQKFSRKIQVCRNLNALDEAMKEVNEQNTVTLDILQAVRDFDASLK